MAFRYSRSILTALALTIPSVANAADTDVATFEALRTVDLRMATIAYRLTTANAALCRRLAPTPGWVIHSLGQYDPGLRGTVRQVFGFDAPIAVEAVVPGAPAASAGISAGDSLASVDGAPFAATGPGDAAATSAARDAALAQIAAEPAAAPLTVTTVRGQRAANRHASRFPRMQEQFRGAARCQVGRIGGRIDRSGRRQILRELRQRRSRGRHRARTVAQHP